MLAQIGSCSRKVSLVFKLFLVLSFMFSSSLKASGDSSSEGTSLASPVFSENTSHNKSSFLSRAFHGTGSFFFNGAVLAVGGPVLFLEDCGSIVFGTRYFQHWAEASFAATGLTLVTGVYYFPKTTLVYTAACLVAAEFLERRDRSKKHLGCK